MIGQCVAAIVAMSNQAINAHVKNPYYFSSLLWPKTDRISSFCSSNVEGIAAKRGGATTLGSAVCINQKDNMEKGYKSY